VAELRTAIIGGGVAGLSAAIRLTELGIFPLIIEGGSYPAQKVCGEFLSPESRELLERWSIFSHLLPELCIHAGGQEATLELPKPAGSLSHLTLDPLLLKRAIAGGAQVYTETRVTTLSADGQGYSLELSNGLNLAVDRLVVATGRLPGSHTVKPPELYRGFKAHFEGIQMADHLEMFTSRGAYLGISPVEDGKCNVAGLATKAAFERYLSVEALVADLCRQHPQLERYLSQGSLEGDRWLEVAVPRFGIKNPPSWNNSYFIGDAAHTIPPASGAGLTLALLGGILAAESLAQNDPEGFRKLWRRRCRWPIFWGKVLQQMFLHPTYGACAARLVGAFPAVGGYLFNHSRLTLHGAELHNIC
jgi:flavin-dependent dehydrogenase